MGTPRNLSEQAETQEKLMRELIAAIRERAESKEPYMDWKALGRSFLVAMVIWLLPIIVLMAIGFILAWLL